MVICLNENVISFQRLSVPPIFCESCYFDFTLQANVWTKRQRYHNLLPKLFTALSFPVFFFPTVERIISRGDLMNWTFWLFEKLIIHQIFSLARDWSKHVTRPNIPQLKLGNIRVLNNSRHLARKYARIFVRGLYLFREANSFPWAKLENR